MAGGTPCGATDGPRGTFCGVMDGPGGLSMAAVHSPGGPLIEGTIRFTDFFPFSRTFSFFLATLTRLAGLIIKN